MKSAVIFLQILNKNSLVKAIDLILKEIDKCLNRDRYHKVVNIL